MTITNPIIPQAAPSSGTTSTTSSGLPTSGSLDNMFMQLLMAQLKNQSTLDPMDPTQFVGQLAQFSELSEVTQIDQTLQQLAGAPTTGASPSNPGTSSPAGNSTKTTNAASSNPPAAMVSSAVSAAQAAIPNFTSAPASFLQRHIQGVF